MNAGPTISIVLPVHNGSRYLDRSIESIVAQTFPNWELILVDDASTDDTPSKIDAWAAREKRIKAVHLHENRRLPGALNEGFRHASADILTWTSDDNWYAPEAFARLLEVLQTRPEVDVVYSGYTEVDAAGWPLQEQPARPPEDLALGNCVGACFLYRRTVGQALGGYDEDLFLAEDYDFWLRAFLQFRLEPLQQPLYFYRKHDESLTEQHARAISLATEKAVVRWLRHADRIPKKMRGRALEALGQRALVRGDVPAGRRFLLRAVLLLWRPPLFRRCRSYAVDFLFGSTAGNLVRRVCRRPPERATQPENHAV